VNKAGVLGTVGIEPGLRIMLDVTFRGFIFHTLG